MLKPDRSPIVSRFSGTEDVSINPLNVSCVFVGRPQGSNITTMSTYWKSPYNDETITQLDTQFKAAVLCSTALKNKIANERVRKNLLKNGTNKNNAGHVEKNTCSARPKSQFLKSSKADQEVRYTPRTPSRMSNPRSQSRCTGNKIPLPVTYSSDPNNNATLNERSVSRNSGCHTLKRNEIVQKSANDSMSKKKVNMNNTFSQMGKKYGLKRGFDLKDDTFVSDTQEVSQNAKVTCGNAPTNQNKDSCFSRCSDGPLEGYSPTSLSFTSPDWSVSSYDDSNFERSSSDKENVQSNLEKNENEDTNVDEEENLTSDLENKHDATQVNNIVTTADLPEPAFKHVTSEPQSTKNDRAKNDHSETSNVCSEGDSSAVISEEIDTLLTSISKKNGRRRSGSENSPRGEMVIRGKRSPKLFISNKVNCLYDTNVRKNRKPAPVVEETTVKFAFDNGRISGKTIENTIGGATVTRSHIRPIMFATFLPNQILPFKSCSQLNNGRINFCDPNKTNQIVQWLRHVKEVQTREGLCMKADSEINANE